MTPAEQLRAAAIEAAAPVLWAHVMADDPLIEAWTEAEPSPQRETRETVAVTYDAMAPVIRRALAEEIACAIEARRAELVQTDEWDDGTDSLTTAAIIAREIGERHV